MKAWILYPACLKCLKLRQTFWAGVGVLWHGRFVGQASLRLCEVPSHAHFLLRSVVHLSSLLHLPPSIAFLFRFLVSIPLFHAGKATRPILGVPAGEAPLVAGLRPRRVGILKRHPAPISVAQVRIVTMQFEIASAAPVRSRISISCLPLRFARTLCACLTQSHKELAVSGPKTRESGSLSLIFASFNFR
jgi:hypothetical protein